jgi:hypothetical protein
MPATKPATTMTMPQSVSMKGPLKATSARMQGLGNDAMPSAVAGPLFPIGINNSDQWSVRNHWR